MGDFDGDGRLDLVSGSNCCDPGTIHLFLRNADGTFAPRQAIKFKRPGSQSLLEALERGRTRPHILDWNRDGHNDLVIGYVGSSELLVSLGPLAGKTGMPVTPFAVPVPKEIHPLNFGFADWDGDGNLDLLMAGSRLKAKEGPWRYGLYWFRNMANRGEPTFEKPARLLIIPKPWELNAFSVVDWDEDGQLELVAGVYQDWKRKEGRWYGNSQLWLFR